MQKAPAMERKAKAAGEGAAEFKHLLSPGRIGKMQVKNRVVMPPMGTGYAGEEGFVSARLANYYEARAEGGTGLIIVEVAAVAPEGRAILRQVGIWADKFVPGLRHLAQRIKRPGARAAIQLHHAGRQTTTAVCGSRPVAPSALPCPVCGEEPREMNVDEIRGTVAAFGHAARRAREAGFDAVEIHGTHGYLVNQFFSPYSNRRSDAYGGDWERRLRFPREVVQAVRAAVGDHFPVLFRMNANEYMEGGITPEEGLVFAGLLEKWGVDAIHVSVGVYGSPAPMIATMSVPETPLEDYAAAIKEKVRLPVIAVGKFHDPELGEAVIGQGRADFIAVGRGLITDSHFVRKIEQGQLQSIRKCIQCNQMCADFLLAYNRPVSCIYNARAGKEGEFPFEKACHAKKVVVVGGGPAGLEAARVARERGHRVVLFDRGPGLGGQALLAKAAPKKDRFGEILRYLIYRNEVSGVEIHRGTPAGVGTVMREKPDAVILATGASPLVPDLPGLDRSKAVTAWEVLQEKVVPGRHVVVVGGGLVGCETAEFLAEKGHRVVVVEMAPELAPDQFPTLRGELLARLEANPAVEIRTGTTVTGVGPSSVHIRREGEEIALEEIDTVIWATGASSFNPLEGPLKERMEEVYAIGDCDHPRNAGEAIHEAFQVAYRL